MSVKISSLNTASTIDSGAAIHIAGNNPLTFSDWGGGWFMQDSTWVRSYNNKSLWMGAGYIGGDGGLTIGYGGATPPSGGAIIVGNVGIGTSTPKSILDIIGNLSVTHTNASSGYSEVLFYENNTLQADIFVNGTSNTNYAGANSMNIWQGSNAPIAFYTNGTNERMRITSSGNVLIGTTTDAGYKLDVNGTARVVGELTVGGDLKYSSNIGYGIISQNGARLVAIQNSLFSVFGSAIISSNITANSLIKSGGTSSQYLMADGSTSTLTNPITGTGTTNYLPKFTGASALGDSLISDNGTLINVAAQFKVAGGDSFFGTGSLTRILGASQVIDFTNAAQDTYVAGRINGLSLKFYGNNGTGIDITSAGSVGIGTASPAYLLDVNGTARVSGATTINGTAIANTVLTLQESASLSGALGMANRNSTQTYRFAVDSAAVDDGNFCIINSNAATVPFLIAPSGAATFSSLAGTGSRMVVADATGVLSTQTIPGGVSGSGTTDYLPKWTGASDLGDSLLQEGTSSIGLGVTPSAWDASFKALQIGVGTALYNNSSANGTFLGSNFFYNGSDNEYISTGTATGYGQVNGTHNWYTAISGSAGTLVSFTNVMKLDASGQLGIGTTTPVTALDVVGGAYTNTTAKFGNTKPIYIINQDPHIGFNTYYDSGWKYGAGSSGSFSGTLGCASSTGDFTLQTSTAGGSAGNTATLAALMTWKQNGYVGIGTNVPSAKLHVVGKGIFNDNVRIYPTSESWAEGLAFIMPTTSTWGGLRWQRERVNDNGNWYLGFTALDSSDDLVFGANNGGSQVDNIIRLTKAGLVGIGTSSPTRSLTVKSSNIGIRMDNSSNSNAGLEYYVSNGTFYNWLLGAQYNVANTFEITPSTTIGGTTYSTPAFVVNANGNVGIGTTSPLNLLHVSQPSANTIFRLGNNASYDQFIYFNGGNDWSLGMDYSNSNAFVLSNASSIGTNDRLVVTTGGNVGIGTTAPLFLLDIAGGNARINGVMVGKGSNSVSTNLAVGVNPLFSNTSGSENTAIGYFAMYSTTTAIRNTALGNNALYSNTTGASNVAVGAGSLYSNIDGRYNSSVGYNSMQFMRGEYNSALGRDSMRGSLTAANNTGEYNTAVGYESMLLLTSGNWNTAVGNQAGTNLSTGSYNTFIGRSTVAAAGGLVTTGSNNTIIGGYAGTTTLASTVVLADGAGQVQLWATGKNVALGTTSPTTYANYTTLHIAGQTTTNGGVLRLTTSDSSIAVNIFTNNAGANYDTTTSHSHLFNINGASSLIVSSSGIETTGSITTADPGMGAAAWQLGDVQTATVSLITSQYVEVVIGGSSYQLALVQLE